MAFEPRNEEKFFKLLSVLCKNETYNQGKIKIIKANLERYTETVLAMSITHYMNEGNMDMLKIAENVKERLRILLKYAE